MPPQGRHRTPPRYLKFGDQLVNGLFPLAQLLLQTPQEFFVFAFRIDQVVIGELTELLFELPFDLVPISFENELVHGLGGFRFS